MERIRSVFKWVVNNPTVWSGIGCNGHWQGLGFSLHIGGDVLVIRGPVRPDQGSRLGRYRQGLNGGLQASVQYQSTTFIVHRLWIRWSYAQASVDIVDRFCST